MTRKQWSLTQKLKIYASVVMFYAFYFPALFLHEISHYLAAKLMFARINSFSLFPSVKFFQDGATYEIKYGYVSFTPLGRVSKDGFYTVYPIWDKLTYILNGLAPFSLFLLPYLVLVFNNIITSDFGAKNLSWLWDIRNIWFWFLVVQVFKGGFPSYIDWAVFRKGAVSPTGIILILLFLFFVANHIYGAGLPL